MAMWTVRRLEILASGPISGQHPYVAVMQDKDAPTVLKYNQATVSDIELSTLPDKILRNLEAAGYTPNDFGIVA